MPDTGAPWNIPYVESTDLVSDWPADSLALANAIDAGLDAAGNAGIGSNVEQTVVTSPVSISTNTTPADITGLSVSITPTSASSLILVLFSIGKWDISADQNAGLHLVRDSTEIGIATSTGNRGAATIAVRVETDAAGTASFAFLDSPNTTSATTYKVQASSTNSATTYINRGNQDADVFTRYRAASSITAIEVAA